MAVEMTMWEREDWRNAGHACRWHCEECGKYGPFDVSLTAAHKAMKEHPDRCPGAVAQ